MIVPHSVDDRPLSSEHVGFWSHFERGLFAGIIGFLFLFMVCLFFSPDKPEFVKRGLSGGESASGEATKVLEVEVFTIVREQPRAVGMRGRGSRRRDLKALYEMPGVVWGLARPPSA